MKTTNVYGIAASNGVVIAKAYKLEAMNLDFDAKTNVDVEAEKSSFINAIEASIVQLDALKVSAVGKLSTEELEVFEAHKMILQDPEITTQVNNAIENDNVDAATASKNVTDTFITMFESLDDEYFKARSADIKDVRKRLIANILGIKIPDLTAIREEVIIVAEDLTPSETSQLNKEFTLGFATDIGGRTSHSAIMARSLEIPAIVGTKNIVELCNDGDLLIMDAIDGEIIINPTDEQIKTYEAKKAAYEEEKALWLKMKDEPSVSKDGHHIEIVANIGTPDDLEGVINNGAEGVGLYRTEFLYMDGTELPNEDVQFEAYKKVLETMGEKPVVIRTLDIGGDKELSYLKFPHEMNPFLGYRAIRLCLDRDDIFRTQLRALLRASVYGNLKVMFPMIATLTEFRDAKAILMEEKEKLVASGTKVSDTIEVGMMVEIPATAMMADLFAKEVDFMSIGTNDLIQYTMACDRMSEKVAYLYQPYNPAILRMVKNVVDAANANNIWAGMCGEMASDPLAIPILLGLGLHEFSMSASAVLQARTQVSKLSREEISTHIDTILNLTTAEEVEAYVVKNFM
ncbi:MAG: phosphoenolpyruvate--protein phosphotransferase [Mycoplasmatales bacterium]